MIFDKTLRIIWGILFVIVFPATIFFKSDFAFVLLFGIGSGIIFIIDFIKIDKQYKNFTSVFAFKRRWHLFANFMQWLFWTALLYIPFAPSYDIKFKLFILIDLFIISTFSFTKFNRSKV